MRVLWSPGERQCLQHRCLFYSRTESCTDVEYSDGCSFDSPDVSASVRVSDAGPIAGTGISFSECCTVAGASICFSDRGTHRLSLD